MKNEIDELNIYQRLAKVRKAVEVIEKNASGYGYKYVSEDEILAKVTGVMDKMHLTLIPSIVPGTFKVDPYVYEKTKLIKGEPHVETVSEIMTQSDMVFTWINDDNPEEKIEIPWAMVGHQADGSQGFGTALTYSYRYFLLKYFGVSTTTDDPDEWRSKQKEAEEAEAKSAAEEIIKRFDEMVRKYLASNPDKSGDIKKMVSKYVKSGDYTKITMPALARSLLLEFENTYVKEEK